MLLFSLSPYGFMLDDNYMNVQNHISLVCAEQFLDTGDVELLNNAKTIDEKAATLLSKYRGKCLFLKGLQKLSYETARALSKFEGELYLGDAAIESLTLKNQPVFLESLAELSDSAAESLSRNWQLFIGITKLSDTAAKSLSRGLGALYLKNLTELSEAAAEAFSTSQRNLILGMPNISDAVAASLSKHRGSRRNGYLALGLTELSIPTAIALTRDHSKGLVLYNLLKLSESIATILSQHEGDFLSVKLPKISDDAARRLSHYRGKMLILHVPELSDIASKDLSRLRGETLTLEVPFLSDKAVESLSNYRGDSLTLDITELTEKAAASLAQYQGIHLDLSRLQRLNDQAAVALSKFQGALHLDDQIKISNAARESLLKLGGFKLPAQSGW